MTDKRELFDRWIGWMNEADTALKQQDLDAVNELLADVPDEELRGLVLALVQQRRDDLDRQRSARIAIQERLWELDIE